MRSMYDMIMDLPLLKGIGRDQVSAMLEKTSIVFRPFAISETLAESGDKCSDIGFIVSGKVRQTYRSDDGKIEISQTLLPGSVIGADSLFGLETTYPVDIKALTEGSLLVFTKEEYMRLLRNDDIYLLNYLNYLSLRSQCSRIAIRRYEGRGVEGLIARWLLSMTDQYGRDIAMRISVEDAAAVTGLTESDVLDRFEDLEKQGIISTHGDTIRIIDRRDFLDLAAK